MNNIAISVNNCPRTELTQIVCDRSKYHQIFEFNIENKLALLTLIFESNPHLKFKWETPEDYSDIFNHLPNADLSWTMMEIYVIDELEMRNACWPFNNAKYYNPYWKMDRTEYIQLSKEIEKNHSMGAI